MAKIKRHNRKKKEQNPDVSNDNPGETLIIQKSSYDKPGFIVQTVLAVVGLFTLIGFI
jgi:hypothetical protein